LNTLMLTTSDEDLARAAELLKGGGLVAFPTETVYGLGANALSERAVKSIFEAKGRPSDNPLIVHIACFEAVLPLVEAVPPAAKLLMDIFWPGPLTIILKKNPVVPDCVTAGLDTVALRMPKNEVALKLLKKCTIPIAAPSANSSGKPSPTLASHVAHDLGGRIDAIVDGGKCSIGLESTVIDMSREVPALLRPGGVTYEQLTEVLGPVERCFECKNGETPRSPGIKYRHYAPRAPLFVVRGNFIEYINENAPKYNKVGVISQVAGEFPENCVVLYLGDRPEEYASNLFAHLRSLDRADIDVIFAQDMDDTGINLATRNRLYKAAGNNVVSSD
jgi:L-threonylcarbamoyladenylate synthase